MESEDISILKYEDHPENLKKEKSLKSNYSNSSSVETQYDTIDNNQQKNR